MISFEKAYETVMAAARPLESEQVPLDEACGRVLAEDVTSDIDMPPFNKSAMDGYACRSADLPGPLDVIEFIPAGTSPTRSVGPGQCSKIMTGAMVPEGADCVIKVEDAESVGEGRIRETAARRKDNICPRAEDVRTGDVVLTTGTRVRPQDVGVLAAVGCVRPRVSRRVRVSVIATGDELVAPAQAPSPAQIRDSNSSQLCAQARAAGAAVTDHGIVRDTADALDAAIADAVSRSDVLLLSGGVSMGDLDLVPDALRARGFELIFEQVATKPGRPTVFGRADGTFVFGLPGNPVSTFVLFEVLVRPFLCALMGHAYRPLEVRLPLAETVRRRGADRTSWLPVSLDADGRVRAAEYHGSAHIHALSRADGLIAVPVGLDELAAGSVVPVRLFRD
jgi:molybdopterin molybdotransferase